MFINRKKELTWLNQLLIALENKKGINGALLGVRRIGKTEILREFKKHVKSNMEEIFKNPNKPFFNQFSLVDIKPFTRRDSERLLKDTLDYLDICHKKFVLPVAG